MSLFKCKAKMSPPEYFGIISDVSRNYLQGGINTYGGDNFEATGSN